MLSSNGFRIQIDTKNEVDPLRIDEHIYIVVNFYQSFSIILFNDRNVDCYAKVYISGKLVGTYLIRRKKSLTINKVNLATRSNSSFPYIDDKIRVIENQYSNVTSGLIMVTFFSKYDNVVDSDSPYLEKNDYLAIEPPLYIHDGYIPAEIVCGFSDAHKTSMLSPRGDIDKSTKTKIYTRLIFRVVS